MGSKYEIVENARKQKHRYRHRTCIIKKCNQEQGYEHCLLIGQRDISKAEVNEVGWNF